MANTERKYAFDWDVITGNLDVARPELGSSTRVEVYRLFQFTLRDILEKHYGTEMADSLFREAGVLAGHSFYEQFCQGSSDLNALLKQVQDQFKSLGIGIFRAETVNTDDMSLIMTIDEDLDCSGMPDTSDQICVYDEGFIRGILESFSGKVYDVREIDCWCAGQRTCRFSATVVES